MHPDLPGNTRKSELLFVHLILRALDSGGRCAVIVPDGVLFGSSRAHVTLRQRLVEENRLDGVVSMPGGVFKPYAGVSTAVLFFTKGARTDRIWYYDMAHDGFSLDDKRQPTAENDIPDLLACWSNRRDPAFQQAREARRAELGTALSPLRAERLRLEGEINRRTFESIIAGESGDGRALERVQADLATLDAEIVPLKSELDRLNRQFWVTKQQVQANKYDLSTSRYRQTAPEPVYHEKSGVTLERLARLEQVMGEEIAGLREMVDGRLRTGD